DRELLLGAEPLACVKLYQIGRTRRRREVVSKNERQGRSRIAVLNGPQLQVRVRDEPAIEDDAAILGTDQEPEKDVEASECGAVCFDSRPTPRSRVVARRWSWVRLCLEPSAAGDHERCGQESRPYSHSMLPDSCPSFPGTPIPASCSQPQ